VLDEKKKAKVFEVSIVIVETDRQRALYIAALLEPMLKCMVGS
jgi:hypothetical protein